MVTVDNCSREVSPAGTLSADINQRTIARWVIETMYFAAINALSVKRPEAQGALLEFSSKRRWINEIPEAPLVILAFFETKPNTS